MTEESTVKFLTERIKAGLSSPEEAQLLYRIIAERVKTRLLDESEADTLSEIFSRLANGEDPADIFCTKRKPGRPKKSTAPRKPMAITGRIPDDFDITQIVHQNIEEGEELNSVCKKVAKSFGMKVKTVRNIYSRNKSGIS